MKILHRKGYKQTIAPKSRCTRGNSQNQEAQTANPLVVIMPGPEGQPEIQAGKTEVSGKSYGEFPEIQN